MAAMAGPEVGLCFHSARVEGQEEDQVDRPLYEGIEMEQEAGTGAEADASERA